MSAADVALLRAFRARPFSQIPTEYLCQVAGQTGAEFLASIDGLRAAGYVLEDAPAGTSYRLRAAPDRLIADDLRAGLESAKLGREIVVLEETDSTNDFLLQMTQPEMAEGLVVFAETQSSGRGQHGKRWASAPRKGLWFSLLLRPKIPLGESARLTTWIAESLAATITRDLAISAAVKPPNDVYVGERKVAGILVEMRATPRSHFAVAGIGVNVNQQPEDFPEELGARAGSLSMACGRSLDRRALAVAILRELDRTYAEIFGA